MDAVNHTDPVHPVDAQAVRAVLSDITDPCSAAAGAPATIVEMGLVRSVEVTQLAEGAHVRVVIGITEPTCLMGLPFTRSARDRLQALPGVAGVDVTLATDADWSEQDADPVWLARLARVRAAKRERLRDHSRPSPDDRAPVPISIQPMRP